MVLTRLKATSHVDVHLLNVRRVVHGRHSMPHSFVHFCLRFFLWIDAVASSCRENRSDNDVASVLLGFLETGVEGGLDGVIGCWDSLPILVGHGDGIDDTLKATARRKGSLANWHLAPLMLQLLVAGIYQVLAPEAKDLRGDAGATLCA